MIVLEMGLAQIKGHVMTQLEPVNVILDMKGILVKVLKKMQLSIYSKIISIYVIHFYNYCG